MFEAIIVNVNILIPVARVNTPLVHHPADDLDPLSCSSSSFVQLALIFIFSNTSKYLGCIGALFF